jgi:hypothetical protein
LVPFLYTGRRWGGVSGSPVVGDLGPGKQKKYVQFDTAKNVRMVLGAVWEVSIESKDQTAIVQDMMQSFLTTCPTKGQWFTRFMAGMHKRMGAMAKQDEAISVELTVALMEEFEKTGWR